MAKFYTPTKISENIRATPEGFLLCLGVPIARTGWQDYADGETPLEPGDDGIVRIYRDSKEVFRPQTIASFQGKAITIRHPQDFIEPSNWKDLAKGVAQNVRRSDERGEDGEECLLADLLITEEMAIQLVKNGLREVSCGYEAEYEQTGEGEGRQFNIVGNHIALVEQGRAGSSYAINDHKGKVLMDVLKELKEKLLSLSKTVDEATAKTVKASKKKTSDADESEEKKESKDEAAYDELVKAVKDLSEKVEGMSKSKDEDDKEEKSKDEDDKEEKSKDEDEEKSEDDDGEEMKIEERVKALEAAVSKMLKNMSKDEDEEKSEDEDEEKSEDEDESESDMAGDEESEESKDEEKEEPKKMGDAARAEILSPGIKATKGEDLKVKALKAAYKTEEGKEVIETITGGKKPVFDSKENVSTLFIAASELLKAKRGTGLEKTKSGHKFEDFDNKVEVMTADKMNELNAAHWARK